MNSTSQRSRLLAGSALLLLSVVAPAACSRMADPQTQVEKMIAAHNRHDVTGQMAFFSDDASISVAGQVPVTGKAAIRNLYEADSVMNSELVYAGLVVEGDTVIVGSAVERNDLLRLLGLPEVHYLPGTRIVFRKGLIQRIETPNLEQKEWRAMRDSFAALMNWLQTKHPELLKELGTGRLSGNNATAARGWIDLAAEWRRSQSGEGNPGGENPARGNPAEGK